MDILDLLDLDSYQNKTIPQYVPSGIPAVSSDIPSTVDTKQLADTAAMSKNPEPATVSDKSDTPQKSYINDIMGSLLAPTSNYNQPGFGDIINSFKTGGVGAGVGKIDEYFNSPEGRQIIGGLVSAHNPYAGDYMVKQAEQQKQLMAQRNMPISNVDKMKMAVELAKTSGDLDLELRKMGISSDEFKKTFGQKEKEFTTTSAQKDKEIATQQQNADLAAKKQNQEVKENQQKMNFETAQELATKGMISGDDFVNYKNNPSAYKLTGGGHGILGLGNKASLEKGVLHIDPVTGVKAYVFKDGTFQREQ